MIAKPRAVRSEGGPGLRIHIFERARFPIRIAELGEVRDSGVAKRS